MKSKIGLIIAIVGILFLSSFVTLNSNISNEVQNQQEIENSEKLRPSNQWTVPYIDILNNWTAVNMTYDWCNYKNGWYIIENVSITGVSGRNGIHIEDTTEKFIIRNCHINEGVIVMYSKNGQLVNNTVDYGYLYGATGPLGIYLLYCNDTIVRENFLNNTPSTDIGYSIFINNCNNITVVGNFLSILQEDFTGIYLQGEGSNNDTCNNLNVVNNTVNNFYWGINMNFHRVGTNYTISGNIVSTCRRGITLGRYIRYAVSRSDRNIISNNTVKQSSLTGILIYSSNNTVIGNEIIECTTGIDVSGNRNNITSNIIRRSEKNGICLENSNYSIISGNFISSRLRCIRQINCYGTIIEDNICYQIPSIFGYYPVFIIGVSIVVTLLIIKFKLKKSK